MFTNPSNESPEKLAGPYPDIPLSGFKFTIMGAGIGSVIPFVGTVAGGLIGAGLDLVAACDEAPALPPATPEVYPETTLVEEIDPDFID